MIGVDCVLSVFSGVWEFIPKSTGFVEAIPCSLVHVIISPAPPPLRFLVRCPLYNHFLYKFTLRLCAWEFFYLGKALFFFLSSWFECGCWEWRVRGFGWLKEFLDCRNWGEEREPVEGKPNKLAIFLFVWNLSSFPWPTGHSDLAPPTSLHISLHFLFFPWKSLPPDHCMASSLVSVSFSSSNIYS